MGWTTHVRELRGQSSDRLEGETSEAGTMAEEQAGSKDSKKTEMNRQAEDATQESIVDAYEWTPVPPIRVVLRHPKAARGL
jgi:hypothetical protein